jgi:hypothetical protein
MRSLLMICFAGAIIIQSAPFSPVLGEVKVFFGGNAGIYTLPGEVRGYIDGYAPLGNRFIWAETSTDQYGYSRQTYKYKHPFPLRTLPNVGVNFGASYIFQSGIGVFLEGCRTFSVSDKGMDQSVPDTFPGSTSFIPHDYRTQTTESNDHLYVKSFQMGFGLSYTRPLKKNAKLIIAGSYGRAYYSQYFRIETISITNNYYQNNGNLVYSEKNSQGSFDVFGIRYSANCLKPALAVEWELTSPLSARVGLAYPVTIIEKGQYFTENSDSYSDNYYPSGRFWAGNVVLDASISLSFWKGGGR